MTETLQINSDRLWQRLMEMAQHGALPGGGCNRQALTDEDRAGRELFSNWCRSIGCEVRLDAIGNVFARLPGTDDSLPPVMTGSHLDTQPSGGKFDGIYGVLGGLEVLETLVENGVRTRHPLEVVVWTNEEGSRFDMAMMGSAVWAGSLPLADAYALRDRDGRSVREELERTGQLGESPARHEQAHAYLELHIEQGPVLEQAGDMIGVVSGVQHMSRHRVRIHGQEAHAGPTPMKLRQDPVMALAGILPDLYQMVDAFQPDGRLTIGFIDARPGSPNTVPGLLEFTVDLRHPVESRYRDMLSQFEDIVGSHCTLLDLHRSNECVWEAPGIEFAPHCVQAVREAVAQTEYRHRDMFSGAGHDACNVSSVVDTAMIFVPCDNGLSHNEAENISQGQAEAGANVLLGALLALAEPA